MPGTRERNRGWTFLGGATVLVALALAPAAVGLSPTPGTDGFIPAPPCGPNVDESPDDLTRLEMEDALQCLINRARQRKGLGLYAFSEKLHHAARLHSQDMNRRNYFSHYSPEGSRPSQRARRAGYLAGVRQWRVAENLGFGLGRLGRPRKVFQAWAESPHHRPQLFNEDLNDFAVGVARGLPQPPFKKSDTKRSAIYTGLFGRRGASTS